MGTAHQNLSQPWTLSLFRPCTVGFSIALHSSSRTNDFFSQGYTADEHNLIAPFFWRFAQRYTNMSFCVAQSFFTKSGVYEERVGVFHLITNSVAQVCAVLARVEHGEISSPPLFGSQIIKRILDNEALRNQWNKDLLTMNARLVSIRWALWNNLDNLDSPGVWQGMIV